MSVSASLRPLIVALMMTAAGGRGIAFASAQSVPEIGPFVVVQSSTGRVVDAATGEIRWEATGGVFVSAAVDGGQGTVYLTVTDADGRETEIVALSLVDDETEVIGRLDGIAVAKAVAPEGDAIRLVTFSSFPINVVPAGLESIDIPERWRSGAVPTMSYRDDAGGILTDTGNTWYGLMATGNGPSLEVSLSAAEVTPTGAELGPSLAIPAEYFYFSFLVSADGRIGYAVDFRHQGTIHRIDLSGGEIERSGTVLDEGSKLPSCGAALSADGKRLYVIRANGDVRDGVEVIDTSTLQRVGRLLAGRDVGCLALTPSGDTLVTVAGTDFVTVDLDDERILAEVPIEGMSPVGIPLLLLAVDGAPR